MTPSPPDIEPVDPQASPTGEALFDFLGFAVQKLSFEHVTRVKPAAGEVAPTAVDYNLTIGAKIRGLGQRAEVTLGTTVIPDPKWRPYKIEVEVVGRFSTSNGTVEQIQLFCQRAAPPILFPYIREIVHRVSMDGRFGPVRLNPLNVQSMLNQTEWSDVPPEGMTPVEAVSPDSSDD